MIAPPPADHHAFTAPVVVRGVHVADLVADADPARIRRVRDALVTVARGLSLALERDSLLAAEQATADSLAEQNAQLRELDRMKDQLVSSVSHELRTPLTSIGGYIEMLLGGESGSSTTSSGTSSRSSTATPAPERIIDDILFVARVDAGRLSLDRSWVDVAEVAALSVEAARPAAGARSFDRARRRRTTSAGVGGPDPALPDVRQPDLQRGQVHAGGRPRYGDPERRGHGERTDRRHRRRYPAGRGRPAVREVLPRVDAAVRRARASG